MCLLIYIILCWVCRQAGYAVVLGFIITVGLLKLLKSHDERRTYFLQCLFAFMLCRQCYVYWNWRWVGWCWSRSRRGATVKQRSRRWSGFIEGTMWQEWWSRLHMVMWWLPFLETCVTSRAERESYQRWGKPFGAESTIIWDRCLNPHHRLIIEDKKVDRSTESLLRSGE